MAIPHDTSWVTGVETLPRWNSTSPPEYDIILDNPAEKKLTPFPFNKDLNQKIICWCGDITTLNTDAIVNCTNETLNDMSPETCRLMARAGPDLKKQLRSSLMGCRTGDSKLSGGYRLAARYVIHTVGPKYHLRYRTAAETALYGCYRSIMNIVREERLESVALCCVHSEKRHYPSQDGAHIAIRTVRRFLEKFGDSIDSVVFVVDSREETVYMSTLPLYFPRSESEGDFAAYHLPHDVGNDDGEPTITERRIRINAAPRLDDADADSLSDMFTSSFRVGHHSFCQMEADVDAKKKKNNKTKSKSHKTLARDYNNEQERYQRLLRRAQSCDFSDFTSLRFLFWSGFDRIGRNVVVCIARQFPVITDENYERVLLYLITTLDRVSEKPFIAVYFHTESSGRKKPPVSFIKDFYSIVRHKYISNFRGLYMLHTSLLSKMWTWLVTSISLGDLKDSVQHLGGLEYLYTRVSPDQIDVPSFIQEYDLKVNGTRYLKHEEDPHQL